MDKYEFNIKVDQIKKLAAKKSFQEAAAIAKEMNWQKVKDVYKRQQLLKIILTNPEEESWNC